MKRLITALLVLLLSAASVSTAAAASDGYTVRIDGGATDAALASIDGESLLKVDVFFDGISDKMLLASLTFDLKYEAKKLEYVTDSQERGVHTIHAFDANGKDQGVRTLLVNGNDAGVIHFAFASDYGCRIDSGKPMITLYFWMKGGQAAGTKFTFTLGSGAEAESFKQSELIVNHDITPTPRTVTADLKPFTLSKATPADVAVSATVEWDKRDVQFRGSTPYVIYDKKAKTPRFTVKNTKTGKTIPAAQYTASFRDNVKPGTGRVTVTFRHGYSGSCEGWFKIYMPATTGTTVENIQNGIKISWNKVDDAKGYVIYRRAWNLVDKGWTTFERWNNTKNTTWTDTKVYAGTRYQYGIKAYYSDPMDNYNLGIVGPLKTTVRITTRTLNSVTPGSKKLTAKWTGSKLFTGYQVQVATDANFKKDVQTAVVDNAKTYSKTIRSLKKGTTYYVRVRSYHVFEGMTYYGQWSNVLNCKVK